MRKENFVTSRYSDEERKLILEACEKISLATASFQRMQTLNSAREILKND
jgi:hypothetical protein